MVYQSESFPEYNRTTKKVTIEEREYTAQYVKNHSAITAVIYEWRDYNSDDPFSNVADYHLTFYIKYKGKRKWTHLTENDFISKFSSRKSGWEIGLFEIFFNLETSVFQNEYRKTSRIVELKSKIKEYQKELKKLLKEIKIGTIKT